MDLGLLLSVKYLYDDLLTIFFFSKVLGRKYSLKVILMAEVFYWIVPTVFRLSVFLNEGIANTELMNVLQILGFFVYCCLFFGSSMGKRALAVICVLLTQLGLEILCCIPVSMVTGGMQVLEADSNFTLWVVVMETPLEPLALYLMYRLWERLEQIRWKTKRQLWSCVLLPLSQFTFLFHLGLTYTTYQKDAPLLSLCGLILGVAADFFMFTLFLRANQKEQAEEKLQKMKHQYQLEQLRYEQLLEQQKETAKLRHDFQNYILTMRNME